MISIEGTIKSIIFNNPSNNYSVMRLTNNVTIVGYIPSNLSGVKLEFSGEWVTHSKYGQQFSVSSYKMIDQNDLENMVKYLSCGLLEGIGLSMANKIVNHFGKETFSILNNDIELIKEIKGIGGNKFEIIKHAWEEHARYAETILYLQNFGISPHMAAKLTEIYHDSVVDIINHNPYHLCFIENGITFAQADRIAMQLGYDSENSHRIKAAIMMCLKESSQNGHVYLPETILAANLSKDYQIDFFFQYSVIRQLCEEDRIIKVNDFYYIKELYDIEKAIERHIVSMASIKKKKLKKQKSVDDFSDEQIEAINASFENNIMIITGGPGTGKTTTLQGIIKFHIEEENKLLLAAPTGRAAKRITEVTGYEAKTIHRLLEYNPLTESFNKNEDALLDCDILILDEVSMIDYNLFYNLLKALPEDTSLVLIGDANQLPAIGPGNLLNDLINSEMVKVIKLEKIFRQAESSRIVTNAHKIIHGEIPELKNEKESDFFFIEKNNPEDIPAVILELISTRLPENYDFDSMKDIQVLSPMYRGNAGVDNLNQTIQKNANNEDFFKMNLLQKFKVNDKVMQTVNNYEKEVFNGDIGFISHFKKTKEELVINYWETDKKYKLSEIEELSLAYAITVHKSQGSEYPCVILPLSDEHTILLNRNLLYTAITRAKKLLVIIGSRYALMRCVNNTKGVNRYTSLFR